MKDRKIAPAEFSDVFELMSSRPSSNVKFHLMLDAAYPADVGRAGRPHALSAPVQPRYERRTRTLTPNDGGQGRRRVPRLDRGLGATTPGARLERVRLSLQRPPAPSGARARYARTSAREATGARTWCRPHHAPAHPRWSDQRVRASRLMIGYLDSNGSRRLHACGGGAG
jgi:hypothetical protein